MNILFLLTKFENSGVTTNTIDLCTALSNLGHDVTILVGLNKPQKLTETEKRHYDRLTKAKVCIKRFNPKPQLYYRLYAFIRIILYVLLKKFDIIHIESPQLSFIPYFLKKKFTTTFHTGDLLPNFYHKKCTHLIAISTEIKKYAIEKFNYSEKDVSIVFHGVSSHFANDLDEKKIIEIKRQNSIPINKLIIGLVGTIEFRKGHDILLNAVSKLNKDLQEKIHIVFVGDINYGNSHSNWIENIVNETELTNKVTFIKYCNPIEIYHTFDIFCLPSRLEGFPLVVLEAMLSRNCVIRSNCEGAYDQINSGITGYIFENENISELAEILNYLISNPEKIKEIATKGFNRAINEFTSDIMAINTVRIYNKIINEY